MKSDPKHVDDYWPSSLPELTWEQGWLFFSTCTFVFVVAPKIIFGILPLFDCDSWDTDKKCDERESQYMVRVLINRPDFNDKQKK